MERVKSSVVASYFGEEMNVEGTQYIFRTMKVLSMYGIIIIEICHYTLAQTHRMYKTKSPL